MNHEDLIPEELRDHPSRSGKLSPYNRSVLIGFFGAAFIALIVWLIQGAPMPGDAHHDGQDAKSSASKQERKPQPEDRLYRGVRSGIPFYNTDTPAARLTNVYTGALSEAVNNKDVVACQSGLKAFAKKLDQQPASVIIDMQRYNESATWQLPTTVTFLTADHIKYACQLAVKIDRMQDLVPGTRATAALKVIDNDSVTTLRDGSKVCFDLLSVDYRYYVQNATPAGRVMLALTSLILPRELSDQQFNILCDRATTKTT